MIYVLINRLISQCNVKCMLQYVVDKEEMKDQLKREGDILDAKLKKATSELQALQNTLLVINTSNNLQRMHLQSVLPNSNLLTQFQITSNIACSNYNCSLKLVLNVVNE